MVLPFKVLPFKVTINKDSLELSSPIRVILRHPSPSPRVCMDERTDGRRVVWRRQNQISRSDGLRVTKFLYLWCFASALRWCASRGKFRYKLKS